MESSTEQFPQHPNAEDKGLESATEEVSDQTEAMVQASEHRSWRLPLTKIWLGVGLLVLLGSGFLGFRLLMSGESRAQTDQPAESAAPAPAVTIATVESQPITRMLETTGTVAAYDLIPVLPKTSGLQIRQILVDEGETVAANQVMAVLDDSVLRSQLIEAEAQIASAQADLRQRQAELSQERARLAEAETNLRRYQDLQAAGAISRQELDRRTTGATTAREAVRVAQADVASAEAAIVSRRAQMQQLQTQLEQTLVRAPVAGLVAERTGTVGNISAGNSALFSIIRDRRLELTVNLPETQLPQVTPGKTVQIRSDSDSRIQVQGRIREIAPLVNPQTRQATVKIDLSTSDLLRPGMFLRASLVTSQSPGLTIPSRAVLPQADGRSLVYVLTPENIVRAQPIQTGKILAPENPEDARIEVTAGLRAGEQIVLAGAGFLKDGDRVKPTRP